MAKGSTIVALTARQVYTDRGHPGVEATVTTENGSQGVAICTAGISVGQHEVEFAYDGGTRWRGRGVQRAVDSVNNVIAPALIGMDAAVQVKVDDAMLNIGGPSIGGPSIGGPGIGGPGIGGPGIGGPGIGGPGIGGPGIGEPSMGGPDAKQRLGGNATAAVSAAVLKAGAASLGIPLYQHIGGVNACTLPVPGEGALNTIGRYGDNGRSGDKPSMEFVCYDFATFAEASYAGWDIGAEWAHVLRDRFGVVRGQVVPAGLVKHDRQIWDEMVKTINKLGYEGRVGLQVDVAAGTYYDKATGKYVGLFSADDKSRDELIETYHWMVKEYPFVILEDPLDEDDYEGHAILTRELGVQIVGDDLFTTNPQRVLQGIAAGAANTVLLKVNQIGSISEAFEMVRLAYRYGYGVQPCSSRGEGVDIADYTVGLMCHTVRGDATGSHGNRFMQIEAELGRRAQFWGKKGLRGASL